MSKARKGTSVKKGLKFFIYGQEGTWKSSMCLEALKMVNENGRPLRVAYIDSEFGSIDNFLEDYENEGIDTENLLVVYTNIEEEVIEWLEDIMNDEDLFIEDDDENEHLVLDSEGNKFIADLIVVDSLTVVRDTTTFGMIEVSERRASVKASKKEGVTALEKSVAIATAGMELKDYNKLNHRGKNVNRKLIANTDKYVVVTAREKIKYKKQKVNGQMESIPIGYLPDCYKGTEYEYYTVLRMFEDEDDGQIKAQIQRKDRTGTFAQGEIIENPSLTMWQSVIDKNKGKKSSTTMKTSYDDDIKKQADSLIKEDGVKVDEIKPEEKVELDTPKALVDAIKACRASLSPSKKKSVGSVFSKAELPPKPTEELTVEVLTKMYEAIQTI